MKLYDIYDSCQTYYYQIMTNYGGDYSYHIMTIIITAIVSHYYGGDYSYHIMTIIGHYIIIIYLTNYMTLNLELLLSNNLRIIVIK